MLSYTISILRHDDSSDIFTFEQASVIVGREAGDVITGDPKMSNRHAELKFNAGQLTITDLSSTNGTYLMSGQRLSAPHPLVPGTALKLGDCTLAVQEVVSGFERGGTQVMDQVAAPAAPMAPAAPLAPAAPPAAGATPQGTGGSASDRVKEFERDIQRQVAEGPTSEGLFDQFKYYLASGLIIYKEHYINGVMTLGLVMIPAALLSALFSFIPVIGIFLGFLVALVQLALAPISTGAMGRWALAAAAGRSLTWKQAWGAAMRNPVQEWLNMAVMSFIALVGFFFLVIPGILLGMFSVPSYLLEEKRFIGANLRSMELVLKEPGRLLGLAFLMILTAVPVMIAAAILAVVVGFVPMIGAPLANVVTVAASMLAVPLIYLLWSLVYFDTRKRLENVDPRVENAAVIDSWQ
jgi:pSer/pThr/pTyr-binding forkhead associated (FHA) protein